MNEQVARDVVLVRAIETTDEKQELLSADDRVYASQSAKALAQWQAADAKSEATQDHFLQQRSEQILKRLSERHPAFARFAKQRNQLNALSWFLPVLALLFGAGIAAIADYRLESTGVSQPGPMAFYSSKKTAIAARGLVSAFCPPKDSLAAQITACAIRIALQISIRMDPIKRSSYRGQASTHNTPECGHVRHRCDDFSLCAGAYDAICGGLGKHFSQRP
jgi:hypothetical protein